MSLPEPNHKLTGSTPPQTPRWVKLSGVIAIVLILLFIISMFVVGGEHSPSRHLPSGTSGYMSPRAQRVQQL